MVQTVQTGGFVSAAQGLQAVLERRRQEEIQRRAERAQLIGTILGAGAGLALSGGNPMGAAAGAGLGRALGGASVNAPGSSADVVQAGLGAAQTYQSQKQTESDKALINAYTNPPKAQPPPDEMQALVGGEPAQTNYVEKQDPRVAALQAAIKDSRDPGRTVQLAGALQQLFQGKSTEYGTVSTAEGVYSYNKRTGKKGEKLGSPLPRGTGTQGGVSQPVWQVTANGEQAETFPTYSEASKWVQDNRTPDKKYAISKVGTAAPVSPTENLKIVSGPNNSQWQIDLSLPSDDPNKATQVVKPGEDKLETENVTVQDQRDPNVYRLKKINKKTGEDIIDLGVASEKPAENTSRQYEEGNQKVTELFKNGKPERTVYAPRWQPGTLARVEEFPIGDDKIKVIRYGEDGHEAETFEVKRFAPGTGKDSIDDLANRLLKKHIAKEKLTPEEMNALKYIGLKGNPVGQVIGAAIGIPGLFRPEDKSLTGGAGTEADPYQPATQEDANMLPDNVWIIDPVSKKKAKIVRTK